MSDTLYVRMGDALVGTLSREQGEFSFAYDASYLKSDAAVPISHSMPLSSSAHRGDVVEHYFDNLLPDEEGVRRRMQRVLDASSARPFDLLSEVGRECVGALQLLTTPDDSSATSIQATPCSDQEIADILSDLGEGRPLGMHNDGEFRISVAGMQDKTAFLWWKKKWHRPEGTTPTTHIFKTAMMRPGLYNSIENEWLCMKLVAALGLPAAAVRMQTFAGVRALVITRFDRQWSQDKSELLRLPQEDFCQALGVSPANKYESDGGPGIADVMAVLWSALDPVAARETFLRAQFVYWLLAATDGHAKNFSAFLHPGGRLELCPFYDVLSAYPLVAQGVEPIQKLKMAMALRGKNAHYHWREFTRERWLATAKRCRFDKKRTNHLIDDTLAQLDSAIETIEKALPADFPTDLADTIFEGARDARDRFS